MKTKRTEYRTYLIQKPGKRRIQRKPGNLMGNRNKGGESVEKPPFGDLWINLQRYSANPQWKPGRKGRKIEKLLVEPCGETCIRILLRNLGKTWKNIGTENPVENPSERSKETLNEICEETFEKPRRNRMKFYFNKLQMKTFQDDIQNSSLILSISL